MEEVLEMLQTIHIYLIFVILPYFRSSLFLDLREGFMLIILVIWRNFDILTAILFPFWFDREQPRYLEVFICSVLLIFITVLLLTGSLPLRPIVFILFVEKQNENGGITYFIIWSCQSFASVQ